MRSRIALALMALLGPALALGAPGPKKPRFSETVSIWCEFNRYYDGRIVIGIPKKPITLSFKVSPQTESKALVYSEDRAFSLLVSGFGNRFVLMGSDSANNQVSVVTVAVIAEKKYESVYTRTWFSVGGVMNRTYHGNCSKQ